MRKIVDLRATIGVAENLLLSAFSNERLSATSAWLLDFRMPVIEPHWHHVIRMNLYGSSWSGNSADKVPDCMCVQLYIESLEVALQSQSALYGIATVIVIAGIGDLRSNIETGNGLVSHI